MIVKNDNDFFKLKLNSESGFVKPVAVVLKFEIALSDGIIQTLEGIQTVKKDDYIMTGLENERYCISKDNFHKKYNILKLLEKNKGITKKNVLDDTIYEFVQPTFKASTIMNNEQFNLSDKDYLVRYGVNEFGIIKNDLFFKLYKVL